MGRPDLELPSNTTPAPAPGRSRTRVLLGLLGFLVLGAVSVLHLPSPSTNTVSPATAARVRASAACEQAEAVLPSFNASALVAGEKDRIVTWLADAVRVPTEIFDVMGPVGEDPRWDVFYKFADYLESAFPLLHKHLTRTRVVTHALVFEWQGSDPSLKPLLLTAHQDVVPVLGSTRDLWTHEPYGGEYDGKRIWGRGSTDDKSGLIGSMAAIELLLQSGQFTPTRTVILALGTDEETGGKVGATALSAWLEDKYGKDSMALLVDEGSGLTEVYGQLFAMPAVGEKGYLDVEMRVETPGGHSSIPPPHTGIGMASLLIAALERNPYPASLSPASPLIAYTACAANHAPKAPSSLRKAINRVTRSIGKGKVDGRALDKVQEWWEEGSAKDGVMPPGMGHAMISTTQAVDIINGGVKVNALPEVVTAIVNHRISVSSSVDELQKRIVKTVAPTAAKLGLEVEAWGKKVDLEAYTSAGGCHGRGMGMGLGMLGHGKGHKDKKGRKTGKLVIGVAWNSTLNPAPVSPYTLDSGAWRVLAGTIRGVYDSRPGAKAEGGEVFVAPAQFTGNTDTKRYWNLTRNIYRFAYITMLGPKLNNVHTVDEFIEADTFVEQVRWFINFIANVDESREI